MYAPLLENEDLNSLEDQASCVSKWFLSYLNQLFALGLTKDLELEDLGKPSKRSRSHTLYEAFSEHWKYETNRLPKKPSLWRALWKTVGYTNIIICVLLFLLSSAISFVPIIILSALVSYFEGNTELSKMELWVYAVAMFVLPMVSSLIAAKSNIIVVNTAVQFRNAMVNMIFRKALLLSPESRQQQSTGKIINMFANDTKQVQNLLYIFNNLLVSPIQIAVTLYLIYLQVGVSTFVGLGYMVLITPLNGLIFGSLNKTRKDKVIQTDYRVKLMNEILNGIRVIKYYAWENAFKDKIEEIRVQELFYLKRIAYIVAFGFSLLFYSTPMILPIIIFYSYIRMGHSLDASTAFTTIALFNMLQMPFAFLPIGIVQYLQSKVSVERITNFLLSGELQGYVQRTAQDSSLLTYAPPDVDKSYSKNKRDNGHDDDDIVISIVNANLGWEHDGASDVERSSDSHRVESSKQGAELLATAGNKGNSSYNEKDPDSTALQESTTINRSVNTLMGINLEIKKGALVAIVGNVGSGKSSLLNTILGEIYLQEGGEVHVSGSIAYCDQRPWILNATVEGNILFGLEKDDVRFAKALDAACLADDLKVLPAGINTEIGERGINLSGGQKARVAIARAVYRDADIYLLDDPLAAVDAHVGQHLFHSCINGALKHKTRLLVTHQIHLLPECDEIIILENGSIKACGSYDSLTRSGIDITAFVPHAEAMEDSADAATVATESGSVAPSTPVRIPSSSAARGRNGSFSNYPTTPATAASPPSFIRSVSSQHSEEHNEVLERVNSIFSDHSEIAGLVVNPIADTSGQQEDTSTDAAAPMKTQGTELMTIEERGSGDVDTSVYWYYIKAAGTCASVGVVIFLLLVQVFALGSNFYLTYWGDRSNDREDGDNPMSNKTNMQYMAVFAALSMGGVICLVIRGLFLAEAQMTASLKMHSRLIDSILGAPVGFFDVTPIGRIINRFSSDMTTVDENLSQSVSQMTYSLFSVVGALAAIAIATKGAFMAIVFPISKVYYDIQKLFRRTNTAISRLESVTRSPIYADFSETLSGLASIRAYGLQQSFAEKLEKAVDANTAPLILSSQAGYWLGIRLDAMGALVTFFVAFFAVACDTFLSPYVGNNFISPGYLALGLNYSFSLTAALKYCIRIMAQLEAQMNSIERVKYYSEEVEQEKSVLVASNAMGSFSLHPSDSDNNAPSATSPMTVVPDSWPVRGEIVAEDISMRYRDGPLVLKGLSFHVAAGEKLGVAGRTGSGKSSLMNALFRIQELAGGRMLIDDIDTAQVPLPILRSRIGIIPQDPVMFSASVRFNLDPFNAHSDDEVWSILASVDMKNHIKSLPNQLDEMVAEGGDNFSAGQRQLICIGRALLRRPKILILDEATASIDNETDDLIQRVVRVIFKESTVLTIAHRLNTIIDSDKIMVLDGGRLGEIGPPDVLLAQPEGLFKSLWSRHQQSHNA